MPLHLLIEAHHIQANLLRVPGQMHIDKLPLVGEERIVHRPKLALRTRCLRRLSSQEDVQVNRRNYGILAIGSSFSSAQGSHRPEVPGTLGVMQQVGGDGRHSRLPLSRA